MREAQTVARLSEPHIIPVHDVGEIDGQLFIDMRLVVGVDLGELIKQKRPLSVVSALNILNQVAAALDAAHSEGLVHRDVRPSNVLIADSNKRVADFAYLADLG